MSTTDTEHRLTFLETRCVYVDRALEDRARTACAHSQRLATAEHLISNHSTAMETLLARVTSMDTTVQELKTQWDLRVERKKAQKAIIQWALSILMGIGVLVGIVSRHEAGLIERILSGLLLHPLP